MIYIMIYIIFENNKFYMENNINIFYNFERYIFFIIIWIFYSLIVQNDIKCLYQIYINIYLDIYTIRLIKSYIHFKFGAYCIA